MKYKDWLDVWFANYIEPSSKTKTCERYSEIIEKHLKVKLGEYELEELSPIVIQKYITELMQSGNLTTGKGLAANSVNGIITVIQNSLKLAYTLGELKEYTADKIRRPKTKEKEVSCFSLAEQKKIEQAALSNKKRKFIGIVICLYYFIAKGVDKIKPNGLMAVITSKGTMDKQNPSIRKYIADRAELVGAVRLPNTAFKQTANTEVVTDILFFRKREERINATIENTEWLATGKTEEGYEINDYYIAHPEMILGTLAKETGLYGAEDITVKPDGRELSEAINSAISRLPQDFYVNPEYSEEAESREEVEVDYDVKPMNLKAVNGKLYMRVGDSMVEQPVPSFPKDAYQRIVEMIAIRKQLRKVLDLQVEGCSDDVLTREQWQLGARYDMFVKRFGYINSKNNLRLFKPDGDSALLFACENVSDDEETVTKADVFTKRTIRPYTAVTSTDDCFEALQISKNERGCVDISYIEELTKKDYETVLAELGNAVFRNPVAVNPEDKYSGFETAEEYLSGRVVDKLQAAERMKQSNPDLIDYDKNISALREVQPTPVKASDIAVRVGTSWIDKELYKEFFCELIGMPYYYRDGVELYYNKHDGSWRIDRTRYARGYDSMNVDKVYGTSRANAYRLFEDCLNQRSTQIYDTVLDADGREKRVLNNSETVAAREKQNKIVEAFKDWIFSDPIRRDELEKHKQAIKNICGTPFAFTDRNVKVEEIERDLPKYHNKIDEKTLSIIEDIEIVIEPTCTHRGYTIHYCEDCGYEYSDSYVPATGHAYEADEHPATCTEKGYTVYTCKNCGDEYTVDGEEAIGHDYEIKTVGRTCESYGYTVHTCKNCADRYVTDYVKPAGHDYEKTVIKAEEGKVGYTKYTCKECDYNYVSDFVTSGDDGYIEENPDTPTEPEQPDKPTEPDNPENPDQPEQPDQPENPDEHTHVYVFDAVVREQEKTMTVSYVCECGDNRTEFVKVEFTSADDGSGVVLIPGENGELDFAVLEGKYIVTITNDNGEELMVYEVDLAKNETKPVEPEQPDKPTEPEQPKEPESPKESEGKDNTETPNDSVKEKKKVSASAILLPILLVLGIGGGVTFFIIKKKKTGKIKKTEKENEKENK